jgi:alpha-beta hydrolase superfamily lysophospholipase
MTPSDLPPITRWENVATPRGAVHIIHGLAEHARRYGRLAAALNAAGFIVWAHDHRGHGTNPVPGIQGHFGDANGWQALADDAWTVSSQILAAWPRLPLFLFAHSMGSFVGQAVIATHGRSYKGVVFSGTNGPVRVGERLLRRAAVVQRTVLKPRSPGTWLHRIVFDSFNAPYGSPPNSWLSRDPAEVAKYNQDPMCGFPLTSQAWLDMLTARVAQSTPSFYRRIPAALPIRIIYGTRDPVGDYGKGVKRLLEALDGAGLTAVSSARYEGARHELVNETNRDEVTRELIEWLEGTTQP